ncbi:lipopolysaccharide biosynthesis protein [Halothiobacillus neapolitanus]|uniref:Lipopolysaccharide biosynthesis protein n=1 Tax=Halothiobacillus neapolitanus (strain ATCC 23641 / DSM 15147 / CIP 104769 / NCIMB 8539 / c2) TaxID=555778 RepID=D0L0W5_HALNC|nr:lipopolysaccharide biosynthesis protein [Halothiobacillus neapolitanus]ACX96338.1 lipopolysaccharide biosynthesis protein [Halothiobacillus neapolitanus c2]TDN66652.1 capsular polysaccharide transport system permease protein [Halothiobacillus neapolitanus]
MSSILKLFKNVFFWIFVLIPTLIVSAYYGLVASNIYVSESQVVVRSADKSSISSASLSGLFQGFGFSNSQSDAYVIQNYVVSHAAVDRLIKQYPVINWYSSKNVDPISRFNGFGLDGSLANFYKYFVKQLGVSVDPMSSVLTISVKAFKADEAQTINRSLISYSEELVNQLNDRARRDTISFSVNQVDKAKEQARESASKLAQFRNESGLLDPQKEAELPLTMIGTLQGKLLDVRSQLAQLVVVSGNSPQIPVLKREETLLKNEIERLENKVAGLSGGSIATKMIEYQRLTLENSLAEQQLGSALASLEQANADARKKQLYLERISAPNLPDEAFLPHRLQIVLATFLLGLIIWGIVELLTAGIREHIE